MLQHSRSRLVICPDVPNRVDSFIATICGGRNDCQRVRNKKLRRTCDLERLNAECASITRSATTNGRTTCQCGVGRAAERRSQVESTLRLRAQRGHPPLDAGSQHNLVNSLEITPDNIANTASAGWSCRNVESSENRVLDRLNRKGLLGGSE